MRHTGRARLKHESSTTMLKAVRPSFGMRFYNCGLVHIAARVAFAGPPAPVQLSDDQFNGAVLRHAQSSLPLVAGR